MSDLPAVTEVTTIAKHDHRLLQPFVERAAEEVADLVKCSMAHYDSMTEEMTAMLTEYEFSRRELYLKMWWEIGRVILDWQQSAEKDLHQHVPLRPFCNGVAKLVGKGERSCYYAVVFRQRFPNVESLEDLPFGKAASWNLVVNKVIPGLNAGKSLEEIGQEDREEMRKQQADKPALLYDGPGRLAVGGNGRRGVDFPEEARPHGQQGQRVQVKVWEDGGA